MALRLARVHTGRRRVLRLKGNSHGWADELAGPDAPGSVAEYVTIIESNDLAALRADLFASLDPGTDPDHLVAHGGTLNAVPVTCAAGIAACGLYRDGAPQRAARARGDG